MWSNILLFASPRSDTHRYFSRMPQSPLPTHLIWQIAHSCPLPIYLVMAGLFLLYRIIRTLFAIALNIPGPRPSWSISTRLVHTVMKASTEAIPPQARHSYTLSRFVTAIPAPAWMAKAHVEAVEISVEDDELWNKVWKYVSGVSEQDPLVDAGLRRSIHAEWVIHWNVKPKMKEDSCVTLYLHGGAHMIGSPGSHRDLISSLSKSVNGPVLAIDYKKSPDAMFPVAIFEAIQAYRNLLTEDPSCINLISSKFFINSKDPYKFKPSQIVVMGDSSGGCLTLQTLLLIADLGLPTPKCAVLMSPQTDMLMSSETMTSNWDSDILCFDRVGYAFGKIAYAGEWFSPVHPVVSPCYQTDFRGLPPVLIQVGDAEVLLGDTKRLFEGMRRYGGVDVEMQVWKDCFHVWHAFAGVIGDAAHEAINEVGEFVRRVEGVIECRHDQSTEFVTFRNDGKVIKVEEKRRKRRVGKS